MRMRYIPAMHSLLLFILVLSIGSSLCVQQKVQTTRTALHVARSLDPDSMESVSVKTRTGDLTTIIVKKRNGRSSNVTNNLQPNATESTNYVLLSSSETKVDSPLNQNTTTIFAQPIRANLTSHNRTDRSERERSLVPDPVYVSSSMVYVKNDNTPTKKGKSLIKLDTDGIPVVTGIRVPDDDSDKQVWRNARVINGILVPYDKNDKDNHYKHKPARKPSTTRPSTNNNESWTKMGSVTKKPTKLTPAPPSLKTDTWNEPKWHLFKKPVTTKPQLSEQPPVLQTIEILDDIERTHPVSNQYTQHPTGLWVAPDPDENPEHKYVTDRILEYIRNINKEEMKRLSVQKFTARDARMLPTSDEQPQIQSRILHVPSASNFPNSALYSPSTQSPSRVSFEEGVRTPVLQYAHPEYGVQSAKAEPSPPEIMHKKDSPVYPEDIHADRGPFVFEPGAPTEQPETVAESSKRSHTVSPYFQRPKKTFAYFYPDKHPYMPHHKPYGKFSPKDDYKMNDYPATIYYEDLDGRPFWIRLGDSLKEQVQSGINKMTDLTRPVVEPLVEATHKISHNLGLTTGNRDLSTIREKLGTVSGSSLILPAIGIMAGGAALGLGAVAVGRYLNYDVVKMRKAKSMDSDHLQIDPTDTIHLEALWAEDNSRSAGGTEADTSSTEGSTSAPSTTTATFTSSSTVSSSSTSASSSKVRRRRSIRNRDLHRYFDNMLQNLETLPDASQPVSTDMYPSTMWSNTPCSKKIFCEAMIAQSPDSVAMMDKKIYTFLSLIHPSIATAVAPHLDDVMKSVKARNCSVYFCPSWTLIGKSKDVNGI